MGLQPVILDLVYIEAENITFFTLARSIYTYISSTIKESSYIDLTYKASGEVV